MSLSKPRIALGNEHYGLVCVTKLRLKRHEITPIFANFDIRFFNVPCEHVFSYIFPSAFLCFQINVNLLSSFHWRRIPFLSYLRLCNFNFLSSLLISFFIESIERSFNESAILIISSSNSSWFFFVLLIDLPT